MTILEANQFVTEVLQGLWSRWKPSNEEFCAWVEKLAIFDYEKARTAVRNVFFNVDSRAIKPPPEKILRQLRRDTSAEFSTAEKFIPEPGEVYGKKAQEEVVANILNGPDTQTRRWLVKYLDKKYPSEK